MSDHNMREIFSLDPVEIKLKSSSSDKSLHIWELPFTNSVLFSGSRESIKNGAYFSTTLISIWEVFTFQEATPATTTMISPANVLVLLAITSPIWLTFWLKVSSSDWSKWNKWYNIRNMVNDRALIQDCMCPKKLIERIQVFCAQKLFSQSFGELAKCIYNMSCEQCNVSKQLVGRLILKSIVKELIEKMQKFRFFGTWIYLNQVYVRSATLLPL